MSVGDPKAAKAAFEKAFAEGEARKKAEEAARFEAAVARFNAAAAEQARKLEEGNKRAAEEAARKEAILNMSPVRIPHGGKRHRLTAKRFFSCIKKVKSKTEGSAIAICTSSLLCPHGRTLHSVSCRRKMSIKTQKRRTLRKK